MVLIAIAGRVWNGGESGARGGMHLSLPYCLALQQSHLWLLINHPVLSPLNAHHAHHAQSTALICPAAALTICISPPGCRKWHIFRKYKLQYCVRVCSLYFVCLRLFWRVVTFLFHMADS